LSFTILFLTMLLGVVAGFLNVVAGGGSLLSLPFLIFLGLDASSANATNRVSILLQNMVAAWQFKREKVLSLKEALSLGFPATVGAVAGTLLAVQMDERFLKIVIALVISMMAVMLVAKPRMWETHSDKKWPYWARWILFFFIGVYGGFIQAGVGFILIWALAGAVGKDLVRANGLKVAIVLCYTVASFAIFYSHNLVNLDFGLALAAGSMTGGWIGTKFAVARGNRWIRYILVVMVVISALRMITSAISG